MYKFNLLNMKLIRTRKLTLYPEYAGFISSLY